jgi:hypothetical protein
VSHFSEYRVSLPHSQHCRLQDRRHTKETDVDSSSPRAPTSEKTVPHKAASYCRHTRAHRSVAETSE